MSCKLKGNHTFTAWAATIGSNEVEENSGVKQEEDEKTASPADEEAKTSGQVRGMDWPIEYIVCFAKVAKLHQHKTEVALSTEVLITLCWTAQRILAKQCEKQIWVQRKGWQRREVWPLRNKLLFSKPPQMKLLKHKDITLPESRPTHSLEWTWRP